jgi:hypothetical protein
MVRARWDTMESLVITEGGSNQQAGGPLEVERQFMK